MTQPCRPLKRQAGVVLVISLIMLLLLTLIGISSMQTVIIEERMAGNMGDRNLAFQAAESALRHAEKFIKDNNVAVNASNINKQQGAFDIPSASAIAGLSAQPTYTITLLAIDLLSDNSVGSATFQITAVATGSNNASVRLRTIYTTKTGRITWQELY